MLLIILAVGVAEKSGLLAALIRKTSASSPRWALPYAVGVVGVLGSIMADAAFVVIPPLAALVFAAAGRHPVRPARRHRRDRCRLLARPRSP